MNREILKSNKKCVDLRLSWAYSQRRRRRRSAGEAAAAAAAAAAAEGEGEYGEPLPELSFTETEFMSRFMQLPVETRRIFGHQVSRSCMPTCRKIPNFFFF